MPAHSQRFPGAKHLPADLVLLYEDRDLLVVIKPAGLLTMSTETTREGTAYWMLTDYVRKGCDKSHNRIFIVHRLDRDTSGVLVFAKTPAAKAKLQDEWDKVEKNYIAIAHGHFTQAEGTISSYLAENEAHIVYSTSNRTKGKLAQTAYRVVKEVNGLSLLEIRLLTGRKNQIRVQLADSGHPVVGDSKYGRANDRHKFLALHARTLSFNHPFTGQRMVFDAPAPASFLALAGEWPKENKPCA
jgi:tRNA pseudouridine32 synthase/23S rRNA pseudouridine746 synthase/23S rRNA pseudouridine1911/1915/1917 synthase